MEDNKQTQAPQDGEQTEQAAAESPKAEETETAQQAAPEKETEEATAVNEEAEAVREELEEVKDRLLRSLAEYDNFRKRSLKDRENAVLYAKTEILTKLLPVIDNFERAAANETASFEDYKKGITMTHNQFCEILSAIGVEAFGESGESFDPTLHSAVMHIEDEAYGENVIVDVFAKGYRLGEKILRPATVRVAN